MPVVGPMEGTLVQQVLKVALLFPVLGRKNTPPLPRGSMGQGEERISSLIRWGDDPIEGFFRTASGKSRHASISAN